MLSALEAVLAVQEAMQFFRYYAIMDDRTCQQCNRYDMSHMTRTEIQGTFPYLEKQSDYVWFPRVHPNCRCELRWEEEQEKEPHRALMNKAKKHFGTTEDFREAGWILPDGSMLDFSGKNEGGTPGQRMRDHTEIGFITPAGSGPQIDYFEGQGGIRFSNMDRGDLAVSLDVNADITAAQWATLKNAVRRNSGSGSYLAFDLDDNHRVIHSDYYKNISMYDVYRLKKDYEKLKAMDHDERTRAYWGK